MATNYEVTKNSFSAEQSIPKISMHDTEHLEIQARAALEMLSKWGMVAGEDGGEDSTGRSKLKLSDVDHMVERACNTVEAAFSEFNKRGWILKLPTIEEMRESVKETESA